MKPPIEPRKEDCCNSGCNPCIFDVYQRQLENFKKYNEVVKKYKEGLVSKYLYNLEIGAMTMWRGPYGHYKIEPNTFSRIIMIAQGTGIAPFMSIIDNILRDEDDMTKVVLCYCCKDIEEVLFRNELYNFNAYWNFSYRVYLSNSSHSEYHKLMYEEPIFLKKFDLNELDDLKPYLTNQFLLCGSHGFMNEYKEILKKENYCNNIILF